MKKLLLDLNQENLLTTISFFYNYFDNLKNGIIIKPSVFSNGDKNIESLLKFIIDEYNLNNYLNNYSEINKLLEVIKEVEDEKISNIIDEKSFNWKYLSKIEEKFSGLVNFSTTPKTSRVKGVQRRKSNDEDNNDDFMGNLE